MRKLTVAVLATLLLASVAPAARAQNVCVILTPDASAVRGVTGCNGQNAVSILLSDPRWAAWQAQVDEQKFLENYNVQRAVHVNTGIALSSTGNSSLNGIYPLDQGTVNGLLAFFSQVSGTAMFTGTISGTNLTTSSLVSGSVKVGDYLSGTGIMPGTQVIYSGPGSGWTVNKSQTIASEPMTSGGLGTGLGTSYVSLGDCGTGSCAAQPLVGRTFHQFDAPHLMYYTSAVNALLGAYSLPSVQANGWPSNAVTIP